MLFEHRQVLFAWQPSGNYVASIGEGSRNLFLFDRRGVQVEEVTLKSTAKVTQLEWDKDGEILAILQQKEDWTVNARSVVSCLARNMRKQNRWVRISLYPESKVVKPNITLLLWTCYSNCSIGYFQHVYKI